MRAGLGAARRSTREPDIRRTVERHPLPRHRRDRARRRGAPGRPARHGRDRHCTLHAAPEVRRRRSDLARPRPRRAFQRSRLDAAVCTAPPDRVRAHRHRPDQHLPRLRLALRRPPGDRRELGNRGHHRPARPGHRQCARDGRGRGLAQRAVRRRRRRPPHLCLRRRRLSAGRCRPGDDRAGRPPGPGQADPAVGRQPHHGRRQHGPVDQRGRRRALSRRGLACGRGRWPRHRRRLGCDRRRQVRSAPVDDRLPHRDRARPGAIAGPAWRPQRQAVRRGCRAGTARPGLGRGAVRGPGRRAGRVAFCRRCATTTSARPGPRASPRCPRRSGPSSSACSPAPCRQAGENGWTTTSAVPPTPNPRPAASSSPPKSTRRCSTACPSGWWPVPISKRPPTTSGGWPRSPPPTAAAPTSTAACAST